MAVKLFDKALMASEDVQSYVGSCKFMANNAYARIHDGAFVNLGGLAKDGVYGATSLDLNVYEAAVPTAITKEDVVVIDLSNISEGIIAGNEYKIGIKLFDRELEAGFAARFRRLQKGDKFYLGEGNIDTVPAVGNVLNAQANKTTLAVGAYDAAKLSVKVLAAKPITVGNNAIAKTPSGYEQIYLVEVM